MDLKSARQLMQMSAAQDDPHSLSQLAVMVYQGLAGFEISFARARSLLGRAIALGSWQGKANMEQIQLDIANVRSNMRLYNPSPDPSPLPPPPWPQTAPLMDKRVETFNLSRQDMNGKYGIAIDFHPVGRGEPDCDKTLCESGGGRRAPVLH